MKQRSPDQLRTVGYVLLAVIIDLCAFLYVTAGKFTWSEVVLAADQAFLLEDADRLLEGKMVYLGPYSVAGPNHPGPAYAMLLASIKFACGGDLPCLYALLSIFQVCGAILGLQLVLRSAGATLEIALLAPWLLFSDLVWLGMARSVWSPAFTSAGLAILLWLSIEFVKGRFSLLLPWVIIGSALIQAHFSQIPVVAWLFIAILPAALRSPRRILIHAALMALLLWTPPLIEAARHGGGNLWRIFQLFAGSPDAVSPMGVLDVFDRFAVERGLSSAMPLWMAMGMSFLAIAGAFRSPAGSFRQAAWIAGGLAAVVCVSLLRVPSRIETYYLLHFNIAFGAIALVGAAFLLAQFASLPRPWALSSRIMVAPVVAILAALALQRAADYFKTDWNVYPGAPLHEIALYIKEKHDSRPVLCTTEGAEAARILPAVFYIFKQSSVNLDWRNPEGVYKLLYRQNVDYSPSEGTSVLAAGSYVLVDLLN